MKKDKDKDGPEPYMTVEELFSKLNAMDSNPPPPSPAEGLLTLGENVDMMREFVEAQRQKLVADGYPESVSWRMAADLWGGIWKGASS